MKIAVPVDQGQVAAHFGHCEEFALAEVTEGVGGDITFIVNPGHRPGFLPRFLADQGVTLLIAGGIGTGAIEIFNDLGIEVCSGAQGKAQDVIDQYLQGELEYSGMACPGHE